MFRLRIGYLVGGITTGLIILLSFFWTIPDGKLHLVFCSVGQGDAAYIRFPDGRDMLVDGGPNDKVLECLGRHMPFWDRHITIVALTHPQKDHLQGLISVLDRYGTDYFVRSDITNTTEGYQKLMDVVKRRKVKQKFVTTGETIAVGSTTLSVLWPSRDQIVRMRVSSSDLGSVGSLGNVLGAKTPTDLNDGSIVFALRYGSFDALLPGDADTRVEHGWRDLGRALDALEVLKFPHHGSKTGMTPEFLDKLFSQGSRKNCVRSNGTIQQVNNSCPLAVISVGKNSYGHPAESVLATLARQGVQIERTDKKGDIEITSDGHAWKIMEK